MIISASRRCDIPSYFGKWFVNRLKAGYVLIQNPYNSNRYSKALLSIEAVDIIVFWTKNPIPFIKYLDEIDAMGYTYYFQYTITPYDKSVECNLPDKDRLIDAFIYLSNRLGRSKMVWRYDPIIIDNRHTIEYHITMFTYMCKKLRGYTNRCVISFVDDYKNVSRRMGYNPTYDMTIENIHILACEFSRIAMQNDIVISTCSEQIDLSIYGISKSSCIDNNIIEDILGTKIEVKIDKNQREECRCMESIEIGTYNCCLNGCNYCYALKSNKQAKENLQNHDPNSEVLIGQVNKEAVITNRKTKSIIIKQISLF